MLRRLYFILPDTRRAAEIIQELQQSGIASRRIALVSRGPERMQIAGITVQNAGNDPGARLERILWNLNLALFFSGLLALLVMLATGVSMAWLGVPLAIMLVTFIAGERFTHVPNTHLQEFAQALRHGEIVLMVDAPPAQVAEIEALIHRHHPDAAAGGVGWSSDLLHV